MSLVMNLILIFYDSQFKKCANEFGSIDMSIVTDEVEKGIKNGNLDVVFSKYCNKRSEALECLNEFEKMIEPCLNQKDRDFKNVFVNIAKNLLEFVCYDNGSEMARKDSNLNFLSLLIVSK